MKKSKSFVLSIYFVGNKKPILEIEVPDNKIFNSIYTQLKAGNEYIDASFMIFKKELFNFCVLN